MDLRNKVALITGSGSGLGRSCAITLAQEGAKVVCVGRSLNSLTETAKRIREIKGSALTLSVNVSDITEVTQAFKETIERFGNLDICINNAGVGYFGPVESIYPDEVKAMLATNLEGLIYCSQIAVRVMKEQREYAKKIGESTLSDKHVVNILSTAAHAARKFESIYTATKWGAAGFTECLKIEAKEFGIHVTSVSPGGMRTPFWESKNAMAHQPNTLEFIDPMIVARNIVYSLKQPSNVSLDHLVIQRFSG